MARLVHVHDGSIVGVKALSQSPFRVGRAHESDFRFAAGQVSRDHGIIEVVREGFLLSDRNSTNGTWVNEKRIKTALLKHGDQIVLAKVARLVFLDSEAKPCQELGISCYLEGDGSCPDCTNTRSDGSWLPDWIGSILRPDVAPGVPGVDLVGSMLSYCGLIIFPLITPPKTQFDYELAEEALQAKTLIIDENQGSSLVHEVQAINQGHKPILILEGALLVGARQNRVVNTTLFVPPRSTRKLPVTCVEEKRWCHSGTTFGYGSASTPVTLRSHLKSSVSHSMLRSRTPQSDQEAIWTVVGSQQGGLGIHSRTRSMEDTFQAMGESIREFQSRLSYVSAATGLALSLGSRIMSVDIFDRTDTCLKVWPRIIAGSVPDALQRKASLESSPSASDLRQLMEGLATAPWRRSPGSADCQEYRAESQGYHASILAVHRAVIHFSLVAGPGLFSV